MKILVFILIMVLSFHSGAQDAAVEENNISQLLSLAEMASRTDLTEFNQLIAQLESQSQSLNQEQQCYLDYLKIYKQGHKGNYPETISRVKRLGERCDDLENQIRIKKFIANTQVITGEYESAISVLNEALQLTDENENELLTMQVYNVAAIVYRLMHLDDLSLQYSEHLIESNYSEPYVCYGLINKYRVLLDNAQPLQHQSDVKSTINDCKKNGTSLASLFLELDWYRYSLAAADNQNATENLVDVLTLEPQIAAEKFKNLTVYYDAVKAFAYLRAEEFEQAKASALSAIRANTTIGHSEQLVLALDVLVSASNRQELHQQAYEYLTEKTAVERQLYENKLDTSVAYYRVKHANLAQELEIERLNQSNKLLALENQLAAETTKRQQLMMLLIVTLLLFLGAWSWKIKKKHDYFKEVAEIDHLTQVFTRKAFEERMRDLLDQHSAVHQPVNLAIMDLDHFKYVNDEHGHLVGDWVLKQAILTCEAAADEDILISRLGGEEFAIVSPGIEPHQMLELMNKMRVAIELMDCTDSGAELTVTASFGVSHSGLSGYNISMLLTHADLALFEAKNKGRNRVVSYQTVMAESPVAKIS